MAICVNKPTHNITSSNIMLDQGMSFFSVSQICHGYSNVKSYKQHDLETLRLKIYFIGLFHMCLLKVTLREHIV